MQNKLLILVALFTVYYLQGALYPSGSIVSQGILLIYLLFGVFCFVKTFGNRVTPRCIMIWSVFFLIHGLCFLISPKEVVGMKNEAIGRVATFNQFKEIATFMLTLFIGYYYSYKNKTSEKNILWFGIIFFLSSVVQYYYSLSQLMIKYGEESTNNAGYTMLTVVPYLPIVFKRKRILGIIMAVVIVALIMWSAKRGALMCLAGAAIFALFYYLKTHKVRLKTIMVIILLSFVVGYFVYQQYLDNEYLQSRMEATMEGKSSNRDVAYSQLFNHWLNETNPLLFLFGNGTAQTITVWGNYGHNDWLELLIDNGLVGTLVYFAMFVATISYIRKARLSKLNKMSAYLCVLILFMQSCFSMGFTGGGNGIFILLLGVIIGNNENKKREARIAIY